MASSGKKKTTMAKLMRESRLRERKAAKKARKDDRKRNALYAAEHPDEISADGAVDAADGADSPDAPDPAVEEQSVDSGVGVSD